LLAELWHVGLYRIRYADDFVTIRIGHSSANRSAVPADVGQDGSPRSSMIFVTSHRFLPAKTLISVPLTGTLERCAEQRRSSQDGGLPDRSRHGDVRENQY